MKKLIAIIAAILSIAACGKFAVDGTGGAGGSGGEECVPKPVCCQDGGADTCGFGPGVEGCATLPGCVYPDAGQPQCVILVAVCVGGGMVQIETMDTCRHDNVTTPIPGEGPHPNTDTDVPPNACP